MERTTKLFITMLLCCLVSQGYAAHRDTLKILKNQEGIIILKLVLCDPKNDEYCLSSHEFYFRKKRYTLGNDELMQQLEQIINSEPEDGSKQYLSKTTAKTFKATFAAHQGYKKIAGTNHFAFDVLANGDTWRRNKGGDIYLLRSQGYDISSLYIIYKIKGTFAMVGPELGKFYEKLYHGYYQPRVKEPVYFPVVEVLSIESFSAISSKEAKRIGVRPYSLEYYRLKTAGMERIFDQAEKGKRDR